MFFSLRLRLSVFLPLALLCLTPLLCCTGCGGKTQHRPHLTQTAKKAVSGGKKSGGRKTPATQRPYVINGITYYPLASARGFRQRGIASWYGEPFHGRRTSNGEIYNMYGDTAAHKTLPMNTMLRVRNLENGRSTVVRVNDRGPFVANRIIDLSYNKARELGVLKKGTARVEIVSLESGRRAPASRRKATLDRAASPRPTTSSGRVAARRPAIPEGYAAASSPVAPSRSFFQAAPAGRTSASRPAIPEAPPASRSAQDLVRGNFFVQVGAFERREDARSLADRFAAQGRDVRIQEYPAAGVSLYRVLVFAGHALSEARAYEARTRALGFRYALLLEQ